MSTVQACIRAFSLFSVISEAFVAVSRIHRAIHPAKAGALCSSGAVTNRYALPTTRTLLISYTKHDIALTMTYVS
jgi:hypothetical protein